MVGAEDILKKAISINSFWQSGMKSQEPLFECGSDSHVGQGSLWACVLQKLNARMASAYSHGDLPRACSQEAAACSQDDRVPTRRRITGKARDPCAAVQDPLPWSAVELPPDSHAGAFRNVPTARPAYTEWEVSNIKRRCSLIRRLGEGTYGRVYVGKYVGEAGHVSRPPGCQ